MSTRLLVLPILLNGLVVSSPAVLAQAKPAETIRFEVTAVVKDSLDHTSVQEFITIECNGSAAETIVLQAVPFPGVAFSNAILSDGSNRQDFELVRNGDGLWEAELEYKLADQETVVFELTYEVIHKTNPIYIPLIFLPVPPTATPEDLFSAVVKVPAQHRLTESFPTNAIKANVTSKHQEYVFKLSAIPSVLKLGLVDSRSWTLGQDRLDGYLYYRCFVFPGRRLLALSKTTSVIDEQFYFLGIVCMSGAGRRGLCCVDGLGRNAQLA